MNKKVCGIFFLSLLLLPLILNLISSQLEEPNLFGITPESGIKLKQKWEYIGENWKNMLLGNSFIKAVDSFLRKISPVFLVLFGVNYSMSLAVFLTTVLWVLLILILKNVLGNTIFSKWVALVISFGLAIGAAQLKLFQMPVNLIIGLFFGEKPWWVKLIIGIGILILAIAIFFFIKYFGKYFAENKKKRKEEEDRMKLAIGAKTGETIYKAAGKS